MEGYNHNLFKAREVLVGEFNLAVTESIRMDMNKIGIFKYEKISDVDTYLCRDEIESSAAIDEAPSGIFLVMIPRLSLRHN